jgi:hypothetical protein
MNKITNKEQYLSLAMSYPYEEEKHTYTVGEFKDAICSLIGMYPASHRTLRALSTHP